MSLITEVDILDESREAFLTYAEEVLTDRAIPSVEDGLLSVHRKLIWTMEDVLGMSNKSKYKKSNSVVGTTLATSYFHGDSSCYGALCKLAQTYLMRYPLVDGDGNLGTQEGNGLEAASRYTNARPHKYADLMMIDFNKGVVPLKETYNGEYYEPVVLPSLFPNALVNGREAIGISMAHNSLPMCLTEVCNGIIAYIKDNNINTDGLMEYIKGPDFPLGGTVINSKDIKYAFETGTSNISLKVQGDYEIKDNKIIFTSIPYRTYRNKIKEQINKNIEAFETVLSDFGDESSVGINRLVFTVKKGINIKQALNKIFALTDLQTTLSYNMNFIVNGTPKLCSLKDLIIAYCNHQDNIIIKATEYDKDKAEKRAHILRGLIIAVDKIDKVIELIKQSLDKDEAREKIIEFLSIDEIQANAILDMKLSRLTKIDKKELIDELKEKEELIAECIHILEDKKYRDELLISKIENMRDKYGDERRTKLENITISKEEKEIVNIEPEKCVVIMTESGYIKRIPTASYRTQRRNGKGIKTQDDITSFIVRTNTIDNLCVFTNFGKMYKILVDNIPVGTNSSKGVPISSLIEMEKGEVAQLIYSIYRDSKDKYILFTTQNGMIKKTKIEEYTASKVRAGIKAINLKDGDHLASVNLINDEPVILITRNGMGIKFKSSDISVYGRVAAGVKGINLSKDDYVVSTLVVRDNKDYVGIFTENGLGKKIELSALPTQGRAGKGLIVSKNAVASSALIEENDEVLITGHTNSICISVKEINTTTRTAMGTKMLQGDNIVSISKI